MGQFVARCQGQVQGCLLVSRLLPLTWGDGRGRGEGTFKNHKKDLLLLPLACGSETYPQWMLKTPQISGTRRILGPVEASDEIARTVVESLPHGVQRLGTL